jgi:hypothetical protein
MPGVVFASSDASEAERLAGVAAADEIGSLNGAPVNGRDVAEVGDVRPVLGEHAAGVRVDLGLPDNVHAGPLEAEVESADAGEEGADVHAAAFMSATYTASA